VAAPRDPIVTLPNGSRVRFGEGEYPDKWRRYVAVHADVAQRMPGDRIVDLRFPGRAVVASAGGG
jgi:cell division septal protein FtsQ